MTYFPYSMLRNSTEVKRQAIWGLNLDCHIPSCVTVGNLQNHSVPWFPHLDFDMLKYLPCGIVMGIR